jgi:hypothetical protein
MPNNFNFLSDQGSSGTWGRLTELGRDLLKGIKTSTDNTSNRTPGTFGGSTPGYEADLPATPSGSPPKPADLDELTTEDLVKLGLPALGSYLQGRAANKASDVAQERGKIQDSIAIAELERRNQYGNMSLPTLLRDSGYRNPQTFLNPNAAGGATGGASGAGGTTGQVDGTSGGGSQNNVVNGIGQDPPDNAPVRDWANPQLGDYMQNARSFSEQSQIAKQHFGENAQLQWTNYGWDVVVAPANSERRDLNGQPGYV